MSECGSPWKRSQEGCVVLNNRDQAALDEIERRLRAEDPAWVEKFVARCHKNPGTWWRRCTTVVLWFTGLLGMATLVVLQSPVGAVLLIAALIAATGRYCYQHKDEITPPH